MADKSFKKIRCVHAKKNTIHFIPEHMITEAYLKENQFIVQEFEEKPVVAKLDYEVNVNIKDIGVVLEPFTEKAVEAKLVKAPKGKLVKK